MKEQIKRAKGTIRWNAEQKQDARAWLLANAINDMDHALVDAIAELEWHSDTKIRAEVTRTTWREQVEWARGVLRDTRWTNG